MKMHPLTERLIAEHGATPLTLATLDAFLARPGDQVMLFSGDPVRFPEGLDVAVVLPELRAAFAGRFGLAVVTPEDEEAIARRYGVDLHEVPMVCDTPRDLLAAQAAISLELFHTFILIHDDIIDRSDTRRGRPTIHRELESTHADAGWSGSPAAFGVAGAILIGDLALSWADDLFHGVGVAEEMPAGPLRRGAALERRQLCGLQPVMPILGGGIDLQHGVIDEIGRLAKTHAGALDGGRADGHQLGIEQMRVMDARPMGLARADQAEIARHRVEFPIELAGR